MIGVEGLLDEREVVTTESSLDLHQMAENPRFVLLKRVGILFNSFLNKEMIFTIPDAFQLIELYFSEFFSEFSLIVKNVITRNLMQNIFKLVQNYLNIE